MTLMSGEISRTKALDVNAVIDSLAAVIDSLAAAIDSLTAVIDSLAAVIDIHCSEAVSLTDSLR